MKQPPPAYWFLIVGFIVAGLVGAVNAGLTRQIAEAQENTREAVSQSERSLALAERRQGEIDVLQKLCTQLQETLAGEKERFESCLEENGRLIGEIRGRGEK